MITINRTTCRQCGMCAGVCPGSIIAFREKSYPRKMPGFDLMCIKCGHCVAVCPTASLTHKEVPVEKCPPIQKELLISPEQCAQFIRARRSIREFKDQPVPRELIQRLIDISHYAPTGHNNQEVEWLVIDDKEILLNIERAAVGWLKEMIEKQPQMAAMMNFKGLLLKQEKELKSFLRGAPALVCAVATKNSPMALIDSTIALTTLELAATSLGLGGCWAGMVYFMAGSYAPVQAVLGIPAGKAGYGFMMLGFPEFRYSRMVARKEAPIIWRS
ncbi:MAG TPA: nitroreductase family protein [Dehalococcoidales bacterium]|nr:nitroreductase family protein [Dehalococcoidales bacterium]